MFFASSNQAAPLPVAAVGWQVSAPGEGQVVEGVQQMVVSVALQVAPRVLVGLVQVARAALAVAYLVVAATLF